MAHHEEVTAVMAQNGQLRDALADWLHYAEENLSEFDGEPCMASLQFDIRLCPRCESAGCIYEKIRKTRAALADG